MAPFEIPSSFRAVLGELAEQQKAKRRELQRRNLARRDRELSKEAERERMRPRAALILRWADEVASSRVLDDLIDGLWLYMEVRKSAGACYQDWLELHPDGSLEHRTRPIETADALLRALPGRVLRDLARLIEEGGIWQRIEELNRGR